MQILKYLTKIPIRHYFKHHMRKIEFCSVYDIEKWQVLFYPTNGLFFTPSGYEEALRNINYYKNSSKLST